jgi:rhodanese-related sulfurtransferase
MSLSPKSAVAETSAATSQTALAHFEARLTFETDCWDTHDALSKSATDFVLLDVRGPVLYQSGHVPGALNLPHGKITERKMNEWPSDTLFVVYCAGPHCNGANKAAAKLAKLGRPVKEMIGGVTGWIDEGFKLATGMEPSTVSIVKSGTAAS